MEYTVPLSTFTDRLEDGEAVVVGGPLILPSPAFIYLAKNGNGITLVIEPYEDQPTEE